jgi:hypothetical protein
VPARRLDLRRAQTPREEDHSQCLSDSRLRPRPAPFTPPSLA